MTRRPLPATLVTWPSELMTTGEVCAAIDVSRMTITRAVKAGRLVPIRRIGEGKRAAYVFNVDVVREYARSRQRS